MTQNLTDSLFKLKCFCSLVSCCCLKGLRRDTERLRKMTLTGTAAKAGKTVNKHTQNSFLLPQSAAQTNKPNPSECHWSDCIR